MPESAGTFICPSASFARVALPDRTTLRWRFIGYLAYIVQCAMLGREYTVIGYKGKQVRDQLHADDVASLFHEFFEAPRFGEVYNIGGGRANSLSILETIALLKEMGLPLSYRYEPQPRVGDHVCYISDLTKVRAHYPNWTIKHDLPAILQQFAALRSVAAAGAKR